MSRRIIKTVVSLDTDLFIGTLSTIKYNVEELIKKYTDSAMMEWDHGMDHFEPFLTISRLETKEEYKARIEKETKIKISKREQAKKTIERLKKEYSLD